MDTRMEIYRVGGMPYITPDGNGGTTWGVTCDMVTDKKTLAMVQV